MAILFTQWGYGLVATGKTTLYTRELSAAICLPDYWVNRTGVQAGSNQSHLTPQRDVPSTAFGIIIRGPCALCNMQEGGLLLSS